MRQVKLYDRDRAPANWMQIIQPGEFAVFHRNAKTGVMTEGDGQPVRAGHESCLIFESLEPAENYCRGQVQQVPGVRCEIFDSAGLAKPPLRVVVNPALEKKLEVSAVAARKKIFLGAMLCLASVLFFYWDYGKGGRLILPTLVGINLLFGGFRVILWGLGVRHRVREQELRQDAVVNPASQSAASKGQ